MLATGGTVAFVMEQHLGHRTFAENLRASLPDDLDVSLVWVPVTYRSEHAGLIRSILPHRASAALTARAEVRDGIRDARPDVAVFNTQVPAALGGRLARAAPYVIVTDVTPAQYDRMAAGYGHRQDRIAPIRWWKHHVNEVVFRRAARCVGWSNWVRDSLIDDYSVDRGQIEVIPPGVDTAHWRPPPSRGRDGSMKVLFVGGDFDRKGGHTLIRAFQALPDDAQLVLVTKSAPPDALAHLGPRVRVVNNVQPNDPLLRQLYSDADVFVLPSHAETFGIAAVEASASGLPVVATDVGGLADIVDDGTTGFLIPPGDADELARALRHLHDHPDRGRAMGAAARRLAEERFDARTNALRLFEVVRSAA